MATRLPSVDVVLVGFGWTASIIAQELTEAGMQVLALERGEYRDTVPDFSSTHIQDELRYAVRNQMFEAPERETLTFRNHRDQTALPMRHAAMGDDPRTSVVNRYLECWDVPNLWVMGSSVFPQNAGYNPTGTVGALTYWAADAMKRYIKAPGPLVQT